MIFLGITMQEKTFVAVSHQGESSILMGKAATLAQQMHYKHISISEQDNHLVTLVYTEKGLEIQLKPEHNPQKPLKLHIDFLSSALTYRRQHGGIKQALARAVGIKPGIRPSIIDATAGLGKDSFLLASLGSRVTMIERSPLLFALLQDALHRMAHSPDITQEIIDSLSLIQGDASKVLNTIPHDEYPNTIYLDPMYPHKRKSALNSLEMRITRELVGDDMDAEILLKNALLCALQRVVVKRPKTAASIGDHSPTHCIQMKNSRYDVYLV